MVLSLLKLLALLALAGTLAPMSELAAEAPSSITTSHIESRRIAWSEIERIDRPRSHVVMGALVGFAIGLAAGSYAAAHESVYSMADENGYAPDPLAAQRTTDVVGAGAAGALTGAVVGIFTSNWKRVAP